MLVQFRNHIVYISFYQFLIILFKRSYLIVLNLNHLIQFFIAHAFKRYLCLFNYNYVCSITLDNLHAQANEWNSFKKTADDLFIEIVYRVPCFAHMINLVYLDITKKYHLLIFMLIIFLKL